MFASRCHALRAQGAHNLEKVDSRIGVRVVFSVPNSRLCKSVNEERGEHTQKMQKATLA